MALATTHSAASRVSSSNVSSFTSNSATWTAGSVFLVATSNDVAAGTADTASLTSDSPVGITWTQVDTQLFNTSLYRLTVWRGVGDGSTGTITASFGAAQTGCNIWADEFTGANTLSPVVQSGKGSGSGTALSATLSAFADAVNNAAWAVGSSDTTGSFSEEAGWTAYSTKINHSTPTHGTFAAYKIGQDTTPTMSVGSSATWGLIAVEVAAAATGSGITLKPLGRLLNFRASTRRASRW